MLKTLILKNLILAEEVTLHLQKGLTVITGETGAGKTALLEALRLILGQRADATKVRRGSEKAVVQASFEMSPSSPIPTLLEEMGISLEEGEELILSREISANGKSRAFIGGQMVPASTLQKISPYLMDFIDQHAHVSLKSQESERQFLDLFAGVDLQEFQMAWAKEKQLQELLQAAEEAKETGESKKQLLQEALDELAKAHFQEGEEEALFEEYTLLANATDLLAHAENGEASSSEAIQRCIQAEKHLEHIGKYDKSLKEAGQMVKEARFHLAEVHQYLQSFQAKMEVNPGRLQFLEARLKQLDTMKRKYGKNLISSWQKMEKELETIENLDLKIEELKKEGTKAKESTALTCQKLSQLRQEASQELSKTLSLSLQELNIPSARVSIRCEKTARSQSGEDAITFFLGANVGEEAIPVRNSSSGGELSRLLFSLKMALADKVKPIAMVFDEIDANVGGETATIIGKKLHQLGHFCQVICITHFPQVARFGDHHLRVFKEEIDGRTIAKVEALTTTSKEIELLRMLGGHQSQNQTS